MYLAQKTQQRRAQSRGIGTIYGPPPMGGLGGWLEDIGDVVIGVATNNMGATITALSAATNDPTQKACVAQVSSSGAVAQLQASITDISKNWQPQGYYTIDEMNSVLTLVQMQLLPALAALSTAPMTTSDAQSLVLDYTQKIKRDLADPSYPYSGVAPTLKTFTDGVAQAKLQGANVINAPGLKRWVLQSLMDVAGAYLTVGVLQCNATFLNDLWGAFTAIGEFVKKIGSLVVGAAEAVFAIPDTVSTIWKVAKYAAIGGAAYYIWKEFLRDKIKARTK